MKREAKNALSRQRILDAALREFSRGYESASLNNVCAENGISKGIIYHYFKDKDELYLMCVGMCFDALTDYLGKLARTLTGSANERLETYFDARLRFFADYPLYLGVFLDAAFELPAKQRAKVAQCRKEFDALNVSVLTEILKTEPLREGLCVETIVEDFRMYMDYFNFHLSGRGDMTPCNEAALREHERICHRQLDILLHGVLGERYGK